MKVVDGDSHLIEPLDLYLQYIEPAYRERAMHVEQDSASGKLRMVVDNKSCGWGAKSTRCSASSSVMGRRKPAVRLNEFDQSLYAGGDWQDMDKRMQFLDAEGIDYQVSTPPWPVMGRRSPGPAARAALCRPIIPGRLRSAPAIMTASFPRPISRSVSRRWPCRRSSA